MAYFSNNLAHRRKSISLSNKLKFNTNKHTHRHLSSSKLNKTHCEKQTKNKFRECSKVEEDEGHTY